MRNAIALFSLSLAYFMFALPACAAGVSPEVTTYVSDTLQLITIIATASAVFFLIKGGYLYITSTGHPESLQLAKQTIRNAALGLVLVLGASLIVSLLTNAMNGSITGTNTATVKLSPIVSAPPSDGLSSILIDSITSFLQNIVQSATKPVFDGIIGFLSNTPSLLNNSVVFTFWLTILGITDSLYVLLIAVLGLHFMSASTFGFEEMELRQLLPRIGLSFLGANVSLFLADYVITTCNVLVKAVLDATGGLNHAYILDAINLPQILTGDVKLITLIFLLLFLILAIVLLLMYISRLILIALLGVLSPLIFLLALVPKCSDFAEIAMKTYIITVFVAFVHVIIIQLASAFLTLPGNNTNSPLSIAVALGLFLTLLRTPNLMMQMAFYSSAKGAMRKVGGHIINVITTSSTASKTRAVTAAVTDEAVKLPRRVVNA